MFVTKFSNKIVIIAIVLGLILFWMLIKSAGIVKPYTAANNTMEPYAEKGSKYIASNLVKPKQDDVIVFNYKDNFYGRRFNILRLIGLPNDTIQLIRGDLYRNGKKLTHIKTVNYYKVSKNVFFKLNRQGLYVEDYNIIDKRGDTISFFLSESTAKKLDIEESRIILSNTYTDEVIKMVYGENWNKHFFGPLIIPDNKYFVLGDNRDNSLDSRFIGLIDKNEVKGTVFIKW